MVTWASVWIFAGSFELAVIRMSRYFDLTQNAVLFGDTLLPVEAFLTTDSVEAELVSAVFDFAKSLAELKLSEIQLALYSAFVLLSSGEFQWLFQLILSTVMTDVDRIEQIEWD